MSELEYPVYANVYIGESESDWFDEYDERYSPRGSAMKRHMEWGMYLDELFETHEIPKPENPRDFRLRMTSIIDLALQYEDEVMD